MGVVLHEMATGRRPFEGSSSAELVSAILRDTPSSITDMRPDLPGDLARIVRRCLEKDPRHRLQTARDVNNEFRELAQLISSRVPVPNSASRAAARPDSGASRADEGFWIAVLPFKFKGAEAGLEALAEGMTEEIITGMSRFPYLRVIAQGSTLGYAHRAVDLRQVGKELGARYVMEGSLRQSGSRLRIAAQLVDATNGVQLWAESYDRPFQPEEMFELQDDVVPKIVSTIGDTQGILAQSMSEAVWHKATEQLTPYEAVLRSFSYMRRVNSPNHAAARDALERAVEQAPSNGLAWAMLAIIFREEYNHGFNLRPDPLGRAFDAARHAVEAEPSNYLAHHALASVHFFRRELQAFQSEANRALQLNPMDGFTFGYLGMLTAFAGDWDRGCSMSERARSVNPHHPGWYWFAPLFDAFRKQEYRLVLEFAQKVNMPSFWRTNIALAATYGHLGELDAARKAIQMLIAGRPEFAASAQEECNKWWTSDLANQIMEGLHKAGLDSPGTGVPPSLSSGNATVRSASGESRVEEGFWVAVLPFKYTGSNEDLKALAEGLSEEIVTGLSRFSYLRVIARGSTLRYANQASELRSVGKELGARYVMEGSLRLAGKQLRLAVQLVDAVSGAHLWAETYERTFKAEDIFSVQDDLVPRIVATVADQHGVLPHSMSSLIRNKSDEQLSPYEAVLRVFSLHERMSPEEHASVRALLERTVEKVSGEGNCWAMLATLYCDEYMFGFPGQPDPLGRAQVAAQRAIEIEPSNWLASQAVAQSLFFRKQWQAFRPVAERTIALNPMDGAACAFMGFLLALSGEWERGCELADAARQLNPHHPGWYWLPAVLNAYRKHDYLGSVDAALRINMPGYFWWPLTSAAAYGQLGDHALAQKALRELLAIRPDFATAAREEFGKWFDDELAEHYLEGIRKAGLENTDEQSSTVAKPTAETTGKAGSANPSIAVLPFANMSADQDQEYFSDGLAEEIINSLAQMPGLKVIARTS